MKFSDTMNIVAILASVYAVSITQRHSDDIQYLHRRSFATQQYVAQPYVGHPTQNSPSQSEQSFSLASYSPGVTPPQPATSQSAPPQPDSHQQQLAELKSQIAELKKQLKEYSKEDSQPKSEPATRTVTIELEPDEEYVDGSLRVTEHSNTMHSNTMHSNTMHSNRASRRNNRSRRQGLFSRIFSGSGTRRSGYCANGNCY